jgi:hypothetical protein
MAEGAPERVKRIASRMTDILMDEINLALTEGKGLCSCKEDHVEGNENRPCDSAESLSHVVSGFQYGVAAGIMAIIASDIVRTGKEAAFADSFIYRVRTAFESMNSVVIQKPKPEAEDNG